MTVFERAAARLYHLAAEGMGGNFEYDFAEVESLEAILGMAAAEKIRLQVWQDRNKKGKRVAQRYKKNSRPGISR